MEAGLMSEAVDNYDKNIRSPIEKLMLRCGNEIDYGRGRKSWECRVDIGNYSIEMDTDKYEPYADEVANSAIRIKVSLDQAERIAVLLPKNEILGLKFERVVEETEYFRELAEKVEQFLEPKEEAYR